jgi:hypothetical protein
MGRPSAVSSREADVSLEAEREQVGERLREAERLLESDPTPQARERYWSLTDRWIELDEAIEAGQTQTARDAAHAAALAPGVPTTFEELKASMQTQREHILDLRVAAEERAEVAKALPQGSARREKAERALAAAEQAVRQAAERTDAFWEEHQMRLSAEAVANDVIEIETKRRWAQKYNDNLLTLRRMNDEALRAGKEGYETEIRRFEATKLLPPAEEFAAAVRDELIEKNRLTAGELDAEKLQAKTEAAIEARTKPQMPPDVVAHVEAKRAREQEAERVLLERLSG